ncbi:MAG: sigma-70 family RNA polymerase sigma factor [Flammeovirgaceae bacterium]|nr:sigma-70 family RNA polymerase sigma factor [Flammeovirgaceae bacterium]
MDANRQFSEKALQDFKLVNQAINEGDEWAFAELMSRYKKSVYFMILKMVRNVDDAEDLTIEAFAKAFKNLGRFKQDYTFTTWLFRIATNNAIDFLRKKKLDTFSINTSYSNEDGTTLNIDIEDQNLTPIESTIHAEEIEFVHLLVTKLPSKYQRIVKLRYFEELSYKEIAIKLDTPLGTIKAQLHRARELMQTLFKDKKQHI